MEVVPSHPLHLWSLQGDTLQNVASDLESIFQTGHYSFNIPENIAEPGIIELTYKPSSKRAMLVLSDLSSEEQASIVPNLDDDVKEETWDSEQTGNFARKLGFLDSEKAGGELVKPFLQINEVCSNEVYAKNVDCIVYLEFLFSYRLPIK